MGYFTTISFCIFSIRRQCVNKRNYGYVPFRKKRLSIMAFSVSQKNSLFSLLLTFRFIWNVLLFIICQNVLFEIIVIGFVKYFQQELLLNNHVGEESSWRPVEKHYSLKELYPQKFTDSLLWHQSKSKVLNKHSFTI